MKVVIFAGGFGTRISELSQFRPKPMIEIGGKPILWHIMKYYSSYGFDDFIICGGYMQYVIKQFFSQYFLFNADVKFNLGDNSMEVLNGMAENWKVAVIDTGLNSMTGGRLKRVQKYIGDEPFMLTYGDGVSNVDLDNLLEFHNKHGKIATITMVSIAQKKGVLECDKNGQITSFREKSAKDSALVNGGYMVLNPQIFNYLKDDSTVFEQEPMTRLAAEGELMGFMHNGFWQCMDTQREKKLLDSLWENGNAPWKRW